MTGQATDHGSAFQQVQERDRAVGSDDLARPVELHHRQPAAGRGDCVAIAGERDLYEILPADVAEPGGQASGEPVWITPYPGPPALPARRRDRPTRYPLEMVLAEKIVTALERATANTRWRDFADIYLLARSHTISAEVRSEAVRTVADHRTVLDACVPADREEVAGTSLRHHAAAVSASS